MNAHNIAERVERSVYTALIAKLALIALPFVAAVTAWLAAAWIDARFIVPLRVLEEKVVRLEASDTAKGSQLSGIGQRVEFQTQLFTRIGAVEDRLQKLDVTLTSLISVLQDRDRRGGKTDREAGP